MLLEMLEFWKRGASLLQVERRVVSCCYLTRQRRDTPMMMTNFIVVVSLLNCSVFVKAL